MVVVDKNFSILFYYRIICTVRREIRIKYEHKKIYILDIYIFDRNKTAFLAFKKRKFCLFTTYIIFAQINLLLKMRNQKYSPI